jgi:hypothetical protein
VHSFVVYLLAGGGGLSRSDSPELAYFVMLRLYHKIGFVRNSLCELHHHQPMDVLHSLLRAEFVSTLCLHAHRCSFTTLLLECFSAEDDLFNSGGFWVKEDAISHFTRGDAAALIGNA